jgi:hypothetical protein
MSDKVNHGLVEGVDFIKEMDADGTSFKFITEKGVAVWQEHKDNGTLFDLYDSLGLKAGHL